MQLEFICDNDFTITFTPPEEFSLDVHTLGNVPLEGSTADALIAALSACQGELLPGFHSEGICVKPIFSE